MQIGQPSRTAHSAGVHRAAHQIFEQGRIFSDALALPILGAAASEIWGAATAGSAQRAMRIFIAARTRFAEDALAQAVDRGVRQMVVLGAGLDTFAYRNPHAGLQVFEVDHPTTQEWKRRRLADAGIAVPTSLTFVPIDFELDTLTNALASVGFNHMENAFFMWLGVVPYLTDHAIFATLMTIARLPCGTQVAFDYGDPPSSRLPVARAAHEARAARVAALGEPWISFFEPARLASRLTTLGFSEIQDVGPPQIAERYFAHRAASVPESGGHVILVGRR